MRTRTLTNNILRFADKPEAYQKGFTALAGPPIFKDEMAKWIRIAGTGDCLPGTSLECLAEGHIVALFNIDGVYYALDGICPHQGGPLANGQMAGSVVACPWHGWNFDVATGRHTSNPAMGQRSFAVRVEQSDVMIGLEEEKR